MLRNWLLVLLLAFAPCDIFAQDPPPNVDGEFDPNNPGVVKRLLEIEKVDATDANPGCVLRIEGRADFDDGAFLQLVLRYPAVDPTTQRGVAWGEAFVAGGRFDGSIELRGRIFAGVFEVLAVMSGVEQPPELAEKYAESYHEANHLFYHGTPDQAARTEELLRSYYFVTASELAASRLQEIWTRADALVQEKDENGRRILVPQDKFEERAWRTWLDDEWRPRVRAIESLARWRRENLIAERFPVALNDLEALARTSLELSTLFSRRVYLANGLAAHAEDGGTDPEGSGSHLDKWSYAMDLARSIEKAVGIEILNLPQIPAPAADLVRAIEGIVRDKKPERLAALAAGVASSEVRGALAEFLESRWNLDTWRVLAAQPSSEDGGAEFTIDIRFLATDRSASPIAGWIRFRAGPGADPAEPWKILSKPEVAGGPVS